LKERHTVATYRSPDDLAEKLERDFLKLLQSKKTDAHVGSAEFVKASAIIERFLLVPNEFSGKDVRLKIKIKGEAYPASKEVCDFLNLVFGSTIGVEIQIVEPKGFSNRIDKLFINAKQIDEIIPFKYDEEREIYAKLQFTPTKIDRVRARFSTETYNELSMYINTHVDPLASITAGKVTLLEPDGMIALLFTHTIIDNNEINKSSSAKRRLKLTSPRS
jgi:hypothetical protein